MFYKKDDTIRLPMKAIKIYKKWRAMKRELTGIHHISQFLIQILERDMYEMKIKRDYAAYAHPHLHADNGETSFKLAECIDHLDKRWKINQISYDEFDKIKIPLSEVKSTIQRIFGYNNDRTISREKDKLLKKLRMKQIREGNNHLVVSMQYVGPDQKLTHLNKPSQEKILHLIEQIKNSPHGILEIKIMRDLGSSELFDQFKIIAAQEGIQKDNEEEPRFKSADLIEKQTNNILNKSQEVSSQND